MYACVWIDHTKDTVCAQTLSCEGTSQKYLYPVFYHEGGLTSSSVSRVTADSGNGMFRIFYNTSVVKTYSYFLKSAWLIPYYKKFLFFSLRLIVKPCVTLSHDGKFIRIPSRLCFSEFFIFCIILRNSVSLVDFCAPLHCWV